MRHFRPVQGNWPFKYFLCIKNKKQILTKKGYPFLVTVNLLAACVDNYFKEMKVFCLVDSNFLKNVLIGHCKTKVNLSTREVPKIGQLHTDQSKSRKLGSHYHMAEIASESRKYQKLCTALKSRIWKRKYKRFASPDVSEIPRWG